MMIVENLSSDIDVKKYLQLIGVDSGGVNILAKKAKVYLISIKNLHVGGANILKQDALSIGADLAVPRGTVLAKTPEVDALLIATASQLKKLAKKELAQPFGLKNLGDKFQEILTAQSFDTAQVMGVINVNEDSFFSESRFKEEAAIEEIMQMIEDGATIIDIGAVSSAPNSKGVSATQELQRLKSIFDIINEKRLYENVAFSIDSYEPSVIRYALESGFSVVNDISGLANDEVCRVAAEFNAKVVIMHMQGRPETMQDNPSYENVLDEVYSFLQERIQKAESFGIEEIILDVGIGFGKSLEDNLNLIKHLGHFKTLNKPLLIGASRKSMINLVDKSKVEDRLGGTIALHLEALRNGATILRVHDVQVHSQAIKIQKSLDLI